MSESGLCAVLTTPFQCWTFFAYNVQFYLRVSLILLFFLYKKKTKKHFV